MRQKTGNYPGVTVEKHVGVTRVGDIELELIDLPGMFALSAHSLEERIAADVVLGRMQDMDRPAGILAVVDATHLYQGLYLVQQVLELDLPVMVALTMTDAAVANGIAIDSVALAKATWRRPGMSHCGNHRAGLDELKIALSELPDAPMHSIPPIWDELSAASEELATAMPATVPRFEIERALIDVDSELAHEVAAYLGDNGSQNWQHATAPLWFGSAARERGAPALFLGSRRHERSPARCTGDHDLGVATRAFHQSTCAGNDWTVRGHGVRVSGGIRLGHAADGCDRQQHGSHRGLCRADPSRRVRFPVSSPMASSPVLAVSSFSCLRS